MMLSGTVTPQWFATVAPGVEPVGGWSVDVTPLRETLGQRFESLRQELDGQFIMFSRAYSVSDDSQSKLDVLGRGLAELQALAAPLEIKLSIRLQGHADGVGTPEKNREVAINRARAVQAELGRRGVSTAGFVLARAPWVSGEEDTARRKVVLLVNRVTGS